MYFNMRFCFLNVKNVFFVLINSLVVLPFHILGKLDHFIAEDFSLDRTALTFRFLYGHTLSILRIFISRLWRMFCLFFLHKKFYFHIRTDIYFYVISKNARNCVLHLKFIEITADYFSTIYSMKQRIAP